MMSDDKPETESPDTTLELPDEVSQEQSDAGEFELSPAEGIEQALQDLLEFADLDLETEIAKPDNRWEIELWGTDQEILLRDHGKILLAIQHLLPRLQRGLTGDSSFVRVDCDGFHEHRTERLADLAAREAHLVEKHQKTRTLPPMPPDERRLIHLSLRDDSAVVTESTGEGHFRRVSIRPALRRPRGF